MTSKKQNQSALFELTDRRGFFMNLYDVNNTKILKDTRANGKDRNWQGKKKRSVLMAEHHEVARLHKKLKACVIVLAF